LAKTPDSFVTLSDSVKSFPVATGVFGGLISPKQGSNLHQIEA